MYRDSSLQGPNSAFGAKDMQAKRKFCWLTNEVFLQVRIDLKTLWFSRFQVFFPNSFNVKSLPIMREFVALLVTSCVFGY
jgi:hypothetical protein